MSRWMTTRRSAKLQNIVIETDADAARTREREEAGEKNKAIVPELEQFDRYAYEEYEEPQQNWSIKCPNSEDMDYYLDQMKLRGIPINTAHDILSDHDMDVHAALRMVIDNDLVPVDLMDSNDKLMLKAVAPLLGTFTDSKKKEYYSPQNLFPGLKMTDIYEEAFKQRLELLSSYNGDIEKAKTVVKRQMAQLTAAKSSSPIGKQKKTVKRKSGTPEVQQGKVPRLSESPINTSIDSFGDVSVSSGSYGRDSVSPVLPTPRNVPVTTKPIEPVITPKMNPQQTVGPVGPVAPVTRVVDKHQLQAELEREMKRLSQLGGKIDSIPNVAQLMTAGEVSMASKAPASRPISDGSSIVKMNSVSTPLRPAPNTEVKPAPVPKVIPSVQVHTAIGPTTTYISFGNVEAASRNCQPQDRISTNTAPTQQKNVQVVMSREEVNKPRVHGIKEEIVVVNDSIATNSSKCENKKANMDKTIARVTEKEALEIFEREVALALETLHPRTVAAILIKHTKQLQNRNAVGPSAAANQNKTVNIQRQEGRQVQNTNGIETIQL